MTAGWPIRCMASPISRPTRSKTMIWVRKITSEGPDPRETSAARAPEANKTAKPRKAPIPSRNGCEIEGCDELNCGRRGRTGAAKEYHRHMLSSCRVGPTCGRANAHGSVQAQTTACRQTHLKPQQAKLTGPSGC